MTASRVPTEPTPAQSLRDGMEQVDAIFGLEGFEPSDGMKALDAAMLAGRATIDDVGRFLGLHARIAGAVSVLQQISHDDPRHAVIAHRLVEQREQLRAMAIHMDGAVRVAFAL